MKNGIYDNILIELRKKIGGKVEYSANLNNKLNTAENNALSVLIPNFHKGRKIAC